VGTEAPEDARAIAFRHLSAARDVAARIEVGQL